MLCCYFSHNVETACRNKVQGLLRKRFQSPTAAESHYFPLKLVASEAAAVGREVLIAPVLHGEDVSGLTPEQTLLILSNILKTYSITSGQPNLVPADDFTYSCLYQQWHISSRVAVQM